MKETLLQMGREKMLENLLRYEDGEYHDRADIERHAYDLANTFISDTLKQPAWALEGMKNKRYYESITHGDEDMRVIQARSMEIGHNSALTDAQKVLIGELDI